ncbi:DUF2489 domain-containing protein [Kushneria phosphatilytica]|nr:DUF2489 domain-containing protein [Kushneria phosphatilytica]
MSMALSLSLLLLAILIVFALAVYALRLRREVVRRREAYRREQRQARDNCLKNLDIIGRAVLADQVDLVEGCIRISVMLDLLGREFDPQGAFVIFDRIRRRTDHLHRHEARRKLTPAERMHEDKDRLHIAAEEREAVHERVEQLLGYARNFAAR